MKEVLILLDLHHASFQSTVEFARKTGHPIPIDSRGWSQIIVSTLSGIRGLDRKKGPDLEDGSDVKAASTWEAIDTPRFNGVIKAGTKSAVSGSMSYLDGVPNLFFVLWDQTSASMYRCRIWCVRPKSDQTFRAVCRAWYQARAAGEITSDNFQLHPPRGLDTNVIRNTCGNLNYPLLFCAERKADKYVVSSYDPQILTRGQCTDAA